VAIIRHKQTNTGEAGRKTRSARADARAIELASVIVELQRAGATTLHAIATALNTRGIPTPTGRGTWQASQVGRLLARVKRASVAGR
jgi:hypothetical protein